MTVCFDIGNNYKNKTKIKFPEKNLEIIVSYNGNQIKFDLIGCIKYYNKINFIWKI